MKISEFRKILKAIDECDAVVKTQNMHGIVVISREKASQELLTCVEGAIIQRRHNLIERLKMAGVQIDELV